MTLADQIREIPFDVPSRVVGERLGCRHEYVRAVRNRTRNWAHYRDLDKECKARRFERDPETVRAKRNEYMKRYRDKNREAYNESRRKLYAKNIDERRRYQRDYKRKKAAERRAAEASQ